VRLFQVEVGLVEAVEKYQAIGSGLIQLMRHVGHGAEVRLSLTATGIVT